MSDSTLLPAHPFRVVIENVAPEVDGGRFAVKRILGDVLKVEATIDQDVPSSTSPISMQRRAVLMGLVSQPRAASRFSFTMIASKVSRAFRPRARSADTRSRSSPRTTNG